MAKVTGPLMSMTASGSIGNTITVLRQLSRNIAKLKSKPGGRPTSKQIARRAYYQQASANWMKLTPLQKAAYRPAADAAQITPYNLYMRQALNAYVPGTPAVWDSGIAIWDAGSAIWI